jgi:hypothetical protein
VNRLDNYVLQLLDEAVIRQDKYIKAVEREIAHWGAQKDNELKYQRIRKWKEQKAIHENRMEQCLRVSRLVEENIKTMSAN